MAPDKREIVTVPAQRFATLAQRGEVQAPSGTPADPPAPPLIHRVGLACGGALLACGGLIGHVAIPIAVPAILAGSLLFAIGLGFGRGFRSLSTVTLDALGARPDAEEAAVLSLLRDSYVLTRERLALTRIWMQELERLLEANAEVRPSPSNEARLIADFVHARLDDLARELRRPDEMVRVGLWLQRADGNLHFVMGSDDFHPTTWFEPGQGIMGRSFARNEMWNVADAPARPEWLRSNDDPEPFSGLLCVPLTKGSTPIGVLCVDRTSHETFSIAAEDIAATLGTMLVLTLTASRGRI